jgi:opacity protein-like surface antigen
MMNFRLIGVAALALMLAGPAMAASDGYGTASAYHELYAHHKLPAQDAIRFGEGNEYPTYHSGWGGLYGDGNYPGSIDENMGPRHLER